MCEKKILTRSSHRVNRIAIRATGLVAADHAGYSLERVLSGVLENYQETVRIVPHFFPFLPFLPLGLVPYFFAHLLASFGLFANIHRICFLLLNGIVVLLDVVPGSVRLAFLFSCSVYLHFTITLGS